MWKFIQGSFLAWIGIVGIVLQLLDSIDNISKLSGIAGDAVAAWQGLNSSMISGFAKMTGIVLMPLVLGKITAILFLLLLLFGVRFFWQARQSSFPDAAWEERAWHILRSDKSIWPIGPLNDGGWAYSLPVMILFLFITFNVGFSHTSGQAISLPYLQGGLNVAFTMLGFYIIFLSLEWLTKGVNPSLESFPGLDVLAEWNAKHLYYHDSGEEISRTLLDEKKHHYFASLSEGWQEYLLKLAKAHSLVSLYLKVLWFTLLGVALLGVLNYIANFGFDLSPMKVTIGSFLDWSGSPKTWPLGVVSFFGDLPVIGVVVGFVFGILVFFTIDSDVGVLGRMFAGGLILVGASPLITAMISPVLFDRFFGDEVMRYIDQAAAMSHAAFTVGAMGGILSGTFGTIFLRKKKR